MRFATLAALVALTDLACQDRDISRIASGGGSTGASTAGASSNASSSNGASPSSASSSGTGGPASSSGVTGTGTSGGTAAGTSGTSTGSPYWDGGYVFCSVDAGTTVSWLCTPGTYFCDTTGNLGSCFQCLSDADCTNESLPTHDPARQRCDLDSGVVGYQNHCQLCLSGSDCMGNPMGPFCNLLAIDTFPSDTLQPSIDDFGFETCTPTPEDCRLDGGPICNGIDGDCNPKTGQCGTRSGYCMTDQDCVGFVSSEEPALLEPICLSWGYCAACDAGDCLSQPCSSDADCGGFFPACLSGYCSCDSEAQCGDAGLVCVPPPDSLGGVAFCGLPCTSPGFPPCESFDDESDCDPASGLCEPCQTDQQCQTDFLTGGPICLDAGGCGCNTDSDCPADEACQLGKNDHGVCGPRPQSCSLISCWGYWCDWDSGECSSTFAGTFGQACHDDYDCSHGERGADYCDPKTGACVLCRNDSDCEHQDGGFSAGTQCVVGDAGMAGCGCASDDGCIGIRAGSHCVTGAGAYGSCGCVTSADCAAGLSCFSGICYQPLLQCSSADDCPPDQACSPYSHTCGDCNQAACRAGEVCSGDFRACRPTCGSGPCPAGEVCDTDDVLGLGYDLCFQCLGPPDCPGDEGCNSETHSCGSCRFPSTGYVFPFANDDAYTSGSNCPPDDICSSFWSLIVTNGVCLSNCDHLSCPADKPICAVLPALTPDHHYCFGCLTDADCADAGPGAWCDVSVGMTFSCQLPL